MFEIEYVTNKNGQPKAVVIPIELWNEILPREDSSLDEISEALEDYCLNKSMDEGQKSPLMDRNEALKYLEE